MSQIEQAVIDEIRARADIVDVVSQYVTLKRSGTNYKGLCPFHGEKTPSFMVSPDKGIYKCFGCGAGGNVFTFLMEQQSMSFGEVLRELARQYGIVLRFTESDNESEQLRVQLRKLNQEASLFFQAQLKAPEHGASARAYLAQRGIELYYQQRFQLGYAREHWSALLEHLRHQGFEDSLLAQSGLFKASERSGELYDFFRNRVIFPIVGVNGDVLAFGGRTLDPSVPAKYINSPETEIYQKGQHIYGLNLAKKSIRERDRAILMEGYLDVVTAHQFGFEEAVAGLGTALTQAQARQLLRFSESKTILMAYDADAAGEKATDRGAEILSQVTAGNTPLRLQVIQIPDREDPDTFLHKFGAEAFETVLKQARDFTAYYIDKILSRHQSDNPVDKSMAAKAAIEALLKIHDPVLQDEYVRYVAERLKIEDTALREQIQQIHKKHTYQARVQTRRERARAAKGGKGRSAFAAASAPPPAPLPLKDMGFISELGLLHLLVEHPEEREQVLEMLSELEFEDESNEELRQYLVSTAMGGLRLDWQELFGVFQEREMHQRLTEIMENPAFQALNFEKSLADFSRNVKLKCLGQEMERLSTEIQQAEQSPDHSTYQALMLQYMELMQEYTQLKQISP